MSGKRISPEIEQDIREARQAGLSYGEIEAEFGVSHQTIYRIVHTQPKARTPKSRSKLSLRACIVCGGNLPCLRCAREERKRRGLVGREPEKEPIIINLDAAKRDLLNAIRRWRLKHPTDVFRPGVLKEGN